MFEIKLSDKCKTNFVNYLNDEINIYEYFGGLKPFIPFVNLINGIYKNKEIENIGGINKNNYLQNFILDIFNVIEQYCNQLNDKKIIQKIDDNNEINTNIIKKGPKIIDKLGKKVIFFLYLLFQIDSNIIPQDINTLINNIINDKEYYSNINKNPFKEIKLFVEKNELESVIESFISIDKMAPDNIINEEINETNNNNIFFNEINKKKLFFSKFNLSQLYRHYAKELFTYNRYWSNKELFFGNNKDNKSKLKYKQLTYYTRNYQQPILYPILESLIKKLKL